MICKACNHDYENEDWWNCPQCGEPTPDHIAAIAARDKPRPPRKPRRPKDTGSLGDLLP